MDSDLLSIGRFKNYSCTNLLIIINVVQYLSNSSVKLGAHIFGLNAFFSSRRKPMVDIGSVVLQCCCTLGSLCVCVCVRVHAMRN